MRSFRQLPLFECLGLARRVLVAGAGGGFDIFPGVASLLSRPYATIPV
ncbi:MAG: hypothetical protein HYV07_03355 [Deltaproteobacteria bacterium]|nr:hypothetical protein [Deltaproteobacteria bacterium]